MQRAHDGVLERLHANGCGDSLVFDVNQDRIIAVLGHIQNCPTVQNLAVGILPLPDAESLVHMRASLMGIIASDLHPHSCVWQTCF